MDFDFQYMLEVIPNLLVYIPTTLYITVISMIVAIIIGGLFAIILFNKVPVLSQLVSAPTCHPFLEEHRPLCSYY